MMRASTRASAITSGMIWGGALLTVGLVRLLRPSYGRRFMSVLASVYPGYGARPTLSDALLGGLYGFIDGSIAGLLYGWLYNNLLLEKSETSPAAKEAATTAH
ncbi:MAG: hypothetical protein ABFD96_02965 [Armatimonadia bacterium]